MGNQRNIIEKKLKELYRLKRNHEQFVNYNRYKKMYRKVFNQPKKIHNSSLLTNSSNKSKTAWYLIQPNKKKQRNYHQSCCKQHKSFYSGEVAEYFNTTSQLLNCDATKNTNTDGNSPTFSFFNIKALFFFNTKTLFFFNPKTLFFHLPDIIEIIKDHKHSLGEDNISTNMLKKCAHLVALPLVYILNCSLEESISPDKLKIVKIKRIYKSDEET